MNSVSETKEIMNINKIVPIWSSHLLTISSSAIIIQGYLINLLTCIITDSDKSQSLIHAIWVYKLLS